MQIKHEIDLIWSELKNHILSPFPFTKGQPLEDAFQSVLRMRFLSMHLKVDGMGQTTLCDLLAVDLNAIMFTIGGRPYNTAKMIKGLSTFQQDGVNRSMTQWMSNTFEVAKKSAASTEKQTLLKQLLSRTVLVSETDCMITGIGSSVEDKSQWKADIKRITSRVLIAKPQPNNDHCDLMTFMKMLPSSVVFTGRGDSAGLRGEVQG